MFFKQIPSVDFKNRLTNQVKILDQTIRNYKKTNQIQKINLSFRSNALILSAKNGIHPQGKQLHSSMIKLGYYNVLSLQNQLLSFYVKVKELNDACKLFDEMLVRNVVTWNTLLHDSQMGFRYFRGMLLERVNPDHVTCLNLLRLSIQLGKIEIGRQLHCCIVKWGFCKDCCVNSCLVDMYAKFGFVQDARLVFDDVLEKDLVLWNIMVSGYALNRLAEDGFRVFREMWSKGVKEDEFTFSSLINCCANLGHYELRKLVHGLVLGFGFDRDVVVASALIDMYSKNENIVDARKVFEEMSERNMISWTTMIVGYGQCGDGKESMKILIEMLGEDFCPDELTLSSVVSSCGNLSLNCEILQVHAYASKIGSLSFLSVSNSFVNAYSKSGSIESAFKSFSLIYKPDLVSYTSMIQAYAFHGFSRKSIEIFKKIVSNGVPRPDNIMFLGVLSACSHGGLVSEGLYYFESMTKDYSIMPGLEHYTCLVDLLGRAGLLNEAHSVMTSMPMAPGADTLGAFIGACKIHKNVELMKWGYKRLLLLEPDKNVNYVLMSNAFANSGRWFDVAKVRTMMRDNCCLKVPGFSWIEVAGDIHAFVSRDEAHPRSLELYRVLKLLYKSIAISAVSTN